MERRYHKFKYLRRGGSEGGGKGGPEPGTAGSEMAEGGCSNAYSQFRSSRDHLANRLQVVVQVPATGSGVPAAIYPTGYSRLSKCLRAVLQVPAGGSEVPMTNCAAARRYLCNLPQVLV